MRDVPSAVEHEIHDHAIETSGILEEREVVTTLLLFEDLQS